MECNIQIDAKFTITYIQVNSQISKIFQPKLERRYQIRTIFEQKLISQNKINIKHILNSQKQITFNRRMDSQLDLLNNKVQQIDSNSSKIQEQDFENSDEHVNQISQTSKHLQQFTISFNTSSDELRKLSQLVPYSNQINEYSEYLTAINKLQSEYDDLSSIFQKVRMFSQQSASYLKNISQVLQEQIIINLPISKQILEEYSNECKKIYQQYQEFQQIYEQKSEKINNINLGTRITNVSNKLREITQSQIPDDVIQSYLDKQRELLEIDQIILTIESNLSLIEVKKNQLSERNIQIKQSIKEKQDSQEIINKELQLKIEQIQSLNKLNSSNKQQLINEISDKIKFLMNQQQKEENRSQEDIYHMKDSLLKSFDQQQQSLKEINVDPVSFFRIYIIDESGSMYGEPFNQAIQAVINTVTLVQKDVNCEDSFCLIQFDNKARIVQNKKPIKQVDVSKIPVKINGGGTDFSSAFLLLQDVLQLCNLKERPQVIFLTDGESGNKSKYLQVLQEISNQFSSKGISLFCLAYGNVNTQNLKECLKIINKAEISLQMKDGSMMQTLYEVSEPQEIVNVFKTISEMAGFNAYQITQKAKAIKDSSDIFINQINQQKDVALNQLKLQIIQEQEQLQIINSEDDIEKFEEQIQKVKKSSQVIQNSVEEEIQILIKQQENNLQTITSYNSEKIAFQQQIATEKQINTAKRQVDQSSIYLKSALDLNVDFINQLQEQGFKHVSMFNQFQISLNILRKKKDDLFNFLNHLQLYMESCWGLITDLQKKVKSLETIQKINLNCENSSIIQKFQQILGINKSQLQSFDIIKEIIFIVDSGLQQYLKDQGLEEFFATKVLGEICNNLQTIYILKVTQLSDDDKGPFLDDYIDDLFNKLVEESSELIQARKEAKTIELEIKELNKEIRLTNDREEIKSNKEQVKDLQKDLKEKKKEIMKLNAEFKKEYTSYKNCIVRSVSFLKQAIDQLQHQANRYKVILPLKNFCQRLSDSSKPINQTQMLKLTEN